MVVWRKKYHGCYSTFFVAYDMNMMTVCTCLSWNVITVLQCFWKQHLQSNIEAAFPKVTLFTELTVLAASKTKIQCCSVTRVIECFSKINSISLQSNHFSVHRSSKVTMFLKITEFTKQQCSSVYKSNSIYKWKMSQYTKVAMFQKNNRIQKVTTVAVFTKLTMFTKLTAFVKLQCCSVLQK